LKRGLLLVLLAISLLLGVRHMDTRGWIPLDKARRPYLQQVSRDRAIIAWRTSDRFIGQAIVEWRLVDDTGGEALSWNKVMGATTPSQYGDKYLDHHVVLSGLPAGGEVIYRASNGDLAVDTGKFRAAPADDHEGPIRIWALGDSGTGGPVQAEVRDSMIEHLGDTPIDMLIHVGDMAYSRGRDGEFTARFFRPYRETLRSFCVWPTPGNHEMKSSESSTEAGPYFEAYLLPKQGECGGVASGTEAYYSFDYGPIHCISLDSSGDAIDPDGAMMRWLEEDLGADHHPWTIAFFHHPPYSLGSHASNNIKDSEGRLVRMREVAVPILEAGGVDLVLAGHSHVYERSALIRGVHGYGESESHPVPATDVLQEDGKIIQWGGDTYHCSGDDGIVYAVIGHGGGHVKSQGEHPVMVTSQAVYGSALITIDGEQLIFENVRSDGDITDRIIIDHRSYGANK